MFFRGPRGFSRITDPAGGQALEFDTQTCQHRGEIIDVPVTSRPEDMVAARCYSCWGIICLRCKDELDRTGKCQVIWARLELVEARGRRLQQQFGCDAVPAEEVAKALQGL